MAIVHIGAGKTGSTALQYFLTHNSAALANDGISYPRIRGASSRSDVIDHNGLAYALERGVSQKQFSRIQAELSSLARLNEQVILSSEVLFMRPFERQFADGPAYLKAKEAMIVQLMELLDGFKRVDILCYIRRHDTWLESVYNQRVKLMREDSLDFTNFAKSFGQAHYLPQLQLWAKHNDRGAVRVRPYDTICQRGNGIIADFSKVLEISSGLTQPALTTRSVNPGLGRDYLEFLKHARAFNLTQRENRRLTAALVSISASRNETQHEPWAWRSYFNPDERHAFFSRFAEADRIVEDNFLDHEFDKLFEVAKAETSQMYPGLSTARAFEIASLVKSYLNDRTILVKIADRLPKRISTLAKKWMKKK